MTKKEVFLIQQKYIDLLKWFEDEEYLPKDYFINSDYYQKCHNNNELEIYPKISINRGYDYIEMGSPSKDDLTIYDLSVNFKFNIKGNEEIMKKWHFFIGRINNDHQKTFKIPKVFNGCYFETFYDNNKVEVSFEDYHGWSQFGAEYKDKPKYYSDGSCVKSLEFIIPIIITYNFKQIKL